MRYLRKTFFWLLRIVGILLFFIVLYFVLVVVLTIIPVNSNIKPAASGIQIFVRTNGVHTDFIVPVETTIINWSTYIKPEDFKNVYNPQYVTFGWGDKGFYIETPEWSDLKATTAFKALFFLSSTAMHVSYLKSLPAENKYNKSLFISEIQYKILIKYILDSFKKGTSGDIILIPGKGYDASDNFYEANGTYSFIKTCNTWLNNGLKSMGVKTAIWAPFDICIFYHINKK